MTKGFRLGYLLLLFVLWPCAAQALSNEQIKEQIIRQSLAAYPGNCPCPYNTDRAGRSCGRRSAYSRAGGYSPICYPADVTEEMVTQFKSSQGLSGGSAP